MIWKDLLPLFYNALEELISGPLNLCNSQQHAVSNSNEWTRCVLTTKGKEESLQSFLHLFSLLLLILRVEFARHEHSFLLSYILVQIIHSNLYCLILKWNNQTNVTTNSMLKKEKEAYMFSDTKMPLHRFCSLKDTHLDFLHSLSSLKSSEKKRPEAEVWGFFGCVDFPLILVTSLVSWQQEKRERQALKRGSKSLKAIFLTLKASRECDQEEPLQYLESVTNKQSIRVKEAEGL